MIYPDKYIDEIGDIQVISISGELIMYYDKYPDKLKDKFYKNWNGEIQNNSGELSVSQTCANTCIFDKSTERYSDTSIYKDNRGYYFKKGGKKYRFNVDIENYLKKE